jgi:hypothetical protein
VFYVLKYETHAQSRVSGDKPKLKRLSAVFNGLPTITSEAIMCCIIAFDSCEQTPHGLESIDIS